MISAFCIIVIMNPRFYHRLEADYLKKVEIWWLKKHGYLQGLFKSGGIEWKHEDKKTSVGFEVSIIGNPRSYLLGDESAEDGYIHFLYSQTGSDDKKQNFDYKVNLTTTPCNYGGWRYWFECLFCQRRVGVLYLRGSYFACRHCQYLTYESRNLSGHWKRAGKIISIPELDALRKEVKRISYNGRPTRKLKRYLRKKQKFQEIYYRNVKALQEIRLKSNQKTSDF